MIYLENTRTLQEVHFPVGAVFADAAQLTVWSTVDRRTVIDTEDITGEREGGYFVARIELPEVMADGEYAWMLEQDKDVIGCGLLVVGNYATPTPTYDSKIEYKQYE